MAILAVLLAVALAASAAFAQEGQLSVTYAENGKEPVLTLSADDPEGVTPIVWSILDDHDGVQNLGIFTDISPSDGDDDSADDVVEADVADFGDFKISQDGVLNFNSPPDYETPMGGTGSDSNTYNVVVQASDGGTMSKLNWFKVTVNVTDKEEGGEVTWTVDPDGSDTTFSANVPPAKPIMQFQAGATLMASVTDDDGPDPVLNIRWQWYRSSSKTAMGTAIANATSAAYTVKDTSTDNDVGMYLRAVATYTDSRGPNKTADLVSDYPVQAARTDNAKPEFVSDTVTREVTEGSSGMEVGAPVTATDADNDVLNYSKSGNADDNERFSIDQATGQLKFAGTLDFDMPTDTGDDPGNNTYVVTIIATDSAGEASDSVTVTITVTDVNEKPTFSEGDSGMAADHMENNEVLTVSTYTASDPEEGTVTLSLSGDDSDKFELNDLDPAAAGSKVLAFMEMPDFEMPGDNNQDNIYEVTVVASDGENTAMRSVTVKVTDSDEEGKVTLSSQDALIGVELTATLADSDGGVPDPSVLTAVKWQWRISDTGDDDTFTDIAKATSDTYMPIAANRGKFLKATAMYTDRTLDEDNNADNNDADDFMTFMNTAMSDSTTAVRNNPDNQAPKFTEGSSAVRIVEENTAADTDIGEPVMATDADGDIPTYTLGGADKDSFGILATSGQLMTNAELDYEENRSHTVTVTADDGYGGRNSSATITVTIHVTDLDDAPTIMDQADSSAKGEQSIDYEENDTKSVITLTARDPEGVTPIVWSLLDDAGGEQNLGIVNDDDDDVGVGDIADRGVFNISQDGVLTFKTPRSYEDDSASGAGDDAKNYRVVVQASDGGMEEHVNWFKVTVNVKDKEEGGTVSWTVDPVSDSTDDLMTPTVMQFRSGATLVATVTDDDGDVSNVRWQWHRSSSKTATGTAIAGATSATYTVTDSPADNNDLGMYLRAVATYNVASRPEETANLVSDYPVRSIIDTSNTAPTFGLSTVARRVIEGPPGMEVGAPVTATDDDDDDVLNYSMSGTADDNERFSIDQATGQLKFAVALDFDMPIDTGDTANNNTYVVTIIATDSAGAPSEPVEVTITVDDVNEKPTFGAADAAATPPANTEGVAADHMENNEVLTVSTYTASDPEEGTVTLSLSGDDAGMFELNDLETPAAGSKMLAFMEMPDFEMPGDNNQDNIYEVTVVASDGENTAMRSVTVKVTDADEGGKVTLSSQDALIGVELTATLADSDGGVPDPSVLTAVEWQWAKSDEADGTFTDITAAKSDTYTPTVGDRGEFLRATAMYTDRTLDEDNNATNNDRTNDGFMTFMNTATSASTTAVRNNPDNQAPKFAEAPSAVRIVEENTPANLEEDNTATTNIDERTQGNIGEVVEATDADSGDTLTYDLGGADKDSFAMSATSGQLMVKADLDYEMKNSYEVTITATDSSGEDNDSATITVTIHVTDLDDAPTIMVYTGPENMAPEFRDGDSTTRSVREGSAAGASVGSPVAATDAEDDTLTYALGGDDADSFDIDMDSGQISVGEGTMLDDDVMDSYSVTVTVDDGSGGSDSIDVTINVTDMQYGCSGPAAADCEALLEAMPKLLGADSTRSLNWDVNTPIADWYGVRKLSESGRVEWLYLHGVSAKDATDDAPARDEVKLNGTIAVELSDLDGLTRLYLHRNNLTGGIPGELSGLNNLVWLRLYDNMLSGGIPDLSGMDSLERLYIHENDLSGEIPMSLGSLSSLTHMLLQRNDLTGEIPAMLGDMSSLVWLGLYDNDLSGGIPMVLGGLSNLQRLYLHGNMLTGEVPSELGNLSSLTNLWLSRNMLTGELPSSLDDLTNLERVRISGGNAFTGCVPAALDTDNDDIAGTGLLVCESGN